MLETALSKIRLLIATETAYPSETEHNKMINSAWKMAATKLEEDQGKLDCSYVSSEDSLHACRRRCKVDRYYSKPEPNQNGMIGQP
jgi:hypothetical protein